MSAQSIHKTSLAGLAEQINVEHEGARQAARTALEHARAAGLLLIEAKAQIGHGEWLPWLTANFEFSPRTAQGYMRLAERWPELEGKNATVAHLGVREALALLAAPKPVIDESQSLVELIECAAAVAGRIVAKQLEQFGPELTAGEELAKTKALDTEYEALNEVMRLAKGRMGELNTVTSPRELVRIIHAAESVGDSMGAARVWTERRCVRLQNDLRELKSRPRRRQKLLAELDALERDWPDLESDLRSSRTQQFCREFRALHPSLSQEMEENIRQLEAI